jgi:hypothetical protein
MVREKEERVAGPYKAVLREEDGALIDDDDGRPADRRTEMRKGITLSASAEPGTATKLTGFYVGEKGEQKNSR